MPLAWSENHVHASLLAAFLGSKADRFAVVKCGESIETKPSIGVVSRMWALFRGQIEKFSPFGVPTKGSWGRLV